MRIRSIRPGFWTNEALADITYRQNLLFIGLWMLADKNGCLEFRPRRIKAELFGLRDITTAELLTDLQGVSEVLLIHFYSASEDLQKTHEATIDDAQYIYIPNFVKHQRLSSWEKNDSEPSAPLPQHYRSTTEALLPEVAEVLNSSEVAEETEVAEEEATSSSELLRHLENFRKVHPECKHVGEIAFTAAIAACRTETAEPDVAEALDAFTRHWSAVASFGRQSPIREFEKYLRKSVKKIAKKKTDAPARSSMVSKVRRSAAEGSQND